jgi:hypothetical protein
LGEVGMTYISPPLQDFGLGSVIGFVMKERRMEKNPDALQTILEDRTGKIKHQNGNISLFRQGQTEEEGSSFFRFRYKPNFPVHFFN